MTSTQQTDRDTLFWVSLAFHPRIGARSFQKLLARFPSIEKVWEATSSKLQREGIDEQLVTYVKEAKKKFPPEVVIPILRRQDIGVLTLHDKVYPALLREISDPPAVLFVKGAMEAKEELALAVVGSRRFSPYGERIVEQFIPELVTSGLTIVSG